jgi:hypothetical protein
MPFNTGSGEIMLDKEINSCNIDYKYSLANEYNLLTWDQINIKGGKHDR